MSKGKLYVNKDDIKAIAEKILDNGYILEPPIVNLAKNDRISRLRCKLRLIKSMRLKERD